MDNKKDQEIETPPDLTRFKHVLKCLDNFDQL